MANRPRRLQIVGEKFWRPLYFVTFNTTRRQKLLDRDRVHEAFLAFCIRAFEEFNVGVGRYVIMPDHVHLFVVMPDPLRLGAWIGHLKKAMSKRIARTLPHWQEGCFEHILRSSESYSAKWEYVLLNPVRAGLVVRAEDWPYHGEIVVLKYD